MTDEPRVFIVGAGRMALALAVTLRGKGTPAVGVWARRLEAARRVSAAAGIPALAELSEMPACDVLILAVTDDAVPDVARLVVERGMATKRHVLLKCSGARSAHEVFAEVVARVGGVGTLHPLRAVADGQGTFAGATIGIEGDSLGLMRARELAPLVGGNAVEISGANMALYHAAAVMASNHVVALLDAAVETFKAAGVAEEQALPALLPLISGAIENIARLGIPRALTGPIARGDVATVKRHLMALHDHVPHLVPLYVTSALRTVSVAKTQERVSAAELDRIADALAAEK